MSAGTSTARLPPLPRSESPAIEVIACQNKRSYTKMELVGFSANPGTKAAHDRVHIMVNGFLLNRVREELVYYTNFLRKEKYSNDWIDNALKYVPESVLVIKEIGDKLDWGRDICEYGGLGMSSDPELPGFEEGVVVFWMGVFKEVLACAWEYGTIFRHSTALLSLIIYTFRNSVFDGQHILGDIVEKYHNFYAVCNNRFPGVINNYESLGAALSVVIQKREEMSRLLVNINKRKGRKAALGEHSYSSSSTHSEVSNKCRRMSA